MLTRLKYRANSLARHYATDASGNMATLMGLSLLMIMTVSGAGLDTARIVSGKQKTIDALDAATLFAASHAEADTFNADAQDFFSDSLEDSPFSFKSATFQKVDNLIIGTAETTLPLAFGSIFGQDNSTISVRSVVALPESAPPCITALSTTANPGVTLNSGAKILAPNCEVHVHSVANPAFSMNGGVTLDVSKVCIAGGNIVNNSGSSEKIQKNCTVASDPYAGQIAEPNFSNCDYNGGNFNGSNISLTPGVYCGWYNFNNGNATVDFAPGTYILRNGGWNVNGGDWSGDGVTFYFADTSKIQFNSGVKANFTAPDAGNYAGIFIAEREGLSKSSFAMNDSRGFIFEGAIYLPSRNLMFNSGSSNSLRKTSIYADRITMNGTTLRIEPLNSSSGTSSTLETVYISE